MSECSDFLSAFDAGSSTLASRLDRPIKATADDAMAAKLATTHAGYYVDPFVDAVCRAPGEEPTKQGRSPGASPRLGQANGGNRGGGRRRTVQPLIKRGTHARVCVMDLAISTFLDTAQTAAAAAATAGEGVASACQIVVLGAGKDTSYFRYRNGNLMGAEDREESGPQRRAGSNRATQSPPRVKVPVHWYEVDHDSVIKEKASLIRKSNLLKSFCPLMVKTPTGYECTGSGVGLLGSFNEAPQPSYHLIGHDLRESPAKLFEKLGLDPALPTLFTIECVSMYVPITACKNLLQALSVSADTVYIACYEPILGSDNGSARGDPFGRVMEQNIVQMGVASPDSCLLQTRTLADQLEKLVRCEGFDRAVGCDMWSAYETIVTDAQRKRASKSEFMDEYEELVLIMRHYCIVVARGGRSPGNARQQPIDLTTIPGSDNTTEERSSSLGWVPGKCLELEKDET